MNTLEERLKYWHIHCLTCGELIPQLLKDAQSDEVMTCPCCKANVGVYINVVVAREKVFTKEQLVIIRCTFI